MNEITTLAGGHNIFSDVKDGWVTVSKEDAVARNPEVIVVIDYGDTTAESKIEFLKQDPALKETSAVQNERFVILPLSAASEGIRAAQAIEILAKGFYPENFKKQTLSKGIKSMIFFFMLFDINKYRTHPSPLIESNYSP
ncbi:ABC transporter substrate-binding protein [Bacillus sp. JJ634]